MSQSKLARRAGVAQSINSSYENEHRDPSISMLTRLIEATGCRLDLKVTTPPGTIGGLPDTPLGRRLRHHRKRVIDAASRRGMSNVRVFGSVARGTDHATSDIDLLVDTNPTVSVVSIIALKRELKELLKRDVDIAPANSLKRSVRNEVLREAVPL